MNAETLRRAASLMRERAQASMASLSDNVPEWYSVDGLTWLTNRGDAEHIASQTPAVALAVADWLDVTAGCMERGCELHGIAAPLGVARTYLRESA